MLDATVESVNGALKRARSGLQRRRIPAADGEPPPRPGSPSEDALVARFVRAYEAADIEALVGMLTDDAFMSMPPMPLEYIGRDVVAGFCAATLFAAGRRFDLLPTRANGQPAFGAYLRRPAGRRPDGLRPGTGLIVIALSGGQVSAMTRFEPAALPRFGLPGSLPS